MSVEVIKPDDRFIEMTLLWFQKFDKMSDTERKVAAEVIMAISHPLLIVNESQFRT